MTVAQAISAIIKEYGIDILNSPEKVQAMVMDSASECEQEKKLFCLLCQKGILTFAREMVLLKDKTQLEAVAMRAKAKLKDDAFISEEYARDSINMLLKGLGFSFEIANEHMNEKKRQEERGDKTILEGQRIEKEYRTLLSYDQKTVIDGASLRDLRKAARTGDVHALLLLGDCYYHGIGVRGDWMIAESFYTRAKESGDKEERREAKRKLNEIFNRRQTDR